MYCPRCGTWANESETACANCGAELRRASHEIAPRLEPEPAPVATSPAFPATREPVPAPPIAEPAHFAVSPPLAESAPPFATTVPLAAAASFAPAAPIVPTSSFDEQPGAAPDAPLVYGGFWRRFWSTFVDGVLLTPYFYTIGILFGDRPFQPPASMNGLLLASSINLVTTWLYSALLESSPWQGSLGQVVLGLRVSDTHGRRVSFARATGRHFARYVSFLTLGVGYLLMLVMPRRQTLHDLIAGTLVPRRGAAS